MSAASEPYTKEPSGMLVMRMLWLTPKLLGPKSSDVTDTAAAKMKPELKPISAVPACSAYSLDTATRTKNAIGVGSNAIASHPVRAKYTFHEIGQGDEALHDKPLQTVSNKTH
eukprot:TRINITY_DN918_c2_g1_i4.p4 TRINITY_DN918_c2_g1~~TRINITY_DN918_c2_g1_i4.p4  ORF type:complete len:113 (-),score=18.85 TRINITY_DN918_c2_g1_i4:347-685(-)